MHLAPSEGLPNVAAPVIDMLYPPGKSWNPNNRCDRYKRKTTTTDYCTYCKNNGYKVRLTVYIQNHMMEKEILLDHKVQYILRDPTVEFAVLETARGGFYVLDWALVFVTLESLIFRKTIWE
jgi:cyanophycin synthetase